MIFYYLLVLLMPFLYPPYLSRVLPGEWGFKLVGAICVVYAVFRLSTQGRLPRYFRSRQARCFLLLALVAVVSSATLGLAQSVFDSPVLIYASLVVLFFVTLTVVDSWGRLRKVLICVCAALALGSVRVVIEWFQFRNRWANYRAGVSVGDGNYFATSAVLCLPFLFLAALHCDKPGKRRFYAGCLALTLLGVTVCASRGGFLALGAAAFFLMLRLPNRFRNLTLISIGVLPLALFLGASPVRRLLNPSRGDQKAAQYRLMAWTAGARMITDHPLFGVGLGNFKPLMPQYADPRTPIDTIAHNTYIEVAAELGLPGLALLLAIPFFAYRSLERAQKRARRARREFPYYAALGLQAGLVGYMTGAFFLSAEYQKLFWLVIMLSMCWPPVKRAAATGIVEHGSDEDQDVLGVSEGETLPNLYGGKL